MSRAQEIYNGLCNFLESRNYEYEKYDEKLIVSTQKGDADFPINITMSVSEPGSLLIIRAIVPYTVPEDKRAEFATAVCYANCNTLSGCFVFDITSGQLEYRIVNCFRDSTTGQRLYSHLFSFAYSIATVLGKRLVMISEGKITLEDLFEFGE